MTSMVSDRLLHNARIFSGEMLRDRGFEISERITNIPFDEFKTRYANQRDLDLYTQHKDDAENKIYVRFFLSQTSKKLSASSLERETNMISQQTDNGEKYNGKPHIVFLCEEDLPSNMLLLLKTDRYKNVEVTTFNSLQFNPVKHFLVPKHEAVPVHEEEAVLAYFNCSRSNMLKEFPRLLSSDAIAKWLGLKSGRLCKITRISEAAGYHDVYRVVT